MCFDLDSRPPIAPIAGGALDGDAADADRRRPEPVRRVPGARRRAERAAVVILPDVRGLHPYYEELALRFAEHGIDALAIDWFGRTAGAEAAWRRVRLHAARRRRRRGRASRPTSRPRSRSCRSPMAIGRRRGSLFTIGFCMGGRMSFLAGDAGARPGRRRSGMYGTLVGPWRNDAAGAGRRGRADGAAGSSACSAAPTRGDHRPRRSPHVRRGADAAAGVDHRLDDLPGGAAQLLRPQGGRVRRRQRGGLGRGPARSSRS